ncbi:MAG: hypothetical protein B7Y45_06640 [Sphingomonas sp. 28-66-16]|nr:MAG: hypothetical protein B7Y45_06640 [Sphingomonas sp. 28-66-16]
MRQDPSDRAACRASTGIARYDSINFSRTPIADLVSHPASRLTMIRHLGVQGDGIVSSTSSHDDAASLLINLTSHGRYRGRVGGEPVDKPLQRGHVSFVPAGIDIDIEYPASHSALLLYVPLDIIAATLPKASGAKPGSIHCERNDRLAQLVFMIESEIRTPGFASDLMIDGLMRAIMTIVARHQSPTPDGQRLYMSPAKLNRVIEYVEANLDGDIGLDDLARIAGLSPFHFSRVFKLATGETPYHFLGSRRLNRARALLARGEMPLAELALACGFASQSHFTAAFTKSMGISPGRYRKQRLG